MAITSFSTTGAYLRHSLFSAAAVVPTAAAAGTPVPDPSPHAG